jgi:polyisoprenyl-teichoic acid--peptidoglycan teichoic acid transferase
MVKNQKNKSFKKMKNSKVVGSKEVKKKSGIDIDFLRKFLRLTIFAALSGMFYLIMVILVFFLVLPTTKNYAFMLKVFAMSDLSDLRHGGKNINLLLLGKGGGIHDAPDLTDTIIVLSIDIDNRRIDTIPLPRDIWIPELRAKLNSVYYWGEFGGVGGISLVKEIVSSLLSQTIQYAIVIDFEGFVEIIDALGGVEVDIERSFIDESYPISGLENDLCDGDPDFACRYETISFEEGMFLMNGDTALKFSRSRNALGQEGTDFARGQRQQRVIQAIKNKMLSREILLSPAKIEDLILVLNKNIETDINEEEIAPLLRLLFDSRNSIYGHVFPEDLFEVPPIQQRYDYLYVLVPKSGNWEEVRKYFENCIILAGC